MRSNLQIKVGTYTGDGADSRNITGVGFRPQLVIVKGANNHSVFKTQWMKGDATAYFANSGANFANGIQEMLADGFQVGTDGTVNTNAVVYHYIAIRGVSGQSYFRTGVYRGDGADDRNYTGGGLNFTPDIVFIKRDGAATARFTTNTIGGANAVGVNGSTVAGNIIQSLIANGFQLGTDTTVNNSGDNHFFFALKKLAGVIHTGTYVGNGADARSITGVGFQPDIVIIKAAGAATTGRLRTSTETGDETLDFSSGAVAADQVQALEADGFQLGTSANVNADGVTFHYIAFKAGNFNAPVSRTST